MSISNLFKPNDRTIYCKKIYAPISADNVIISSTIDSTDIASGALIISGGAGIQKTLNVHDIKSLKLLKFTNDFDMNKIILWDQHNDGKLTVSLGVLEHETQLHIMNIESHFSIYRGDIFPISTEIFRVESDGHTKCGDISSTGHINSNTASFDDGLDIINGLYRGSSIAGGIWWLIYRIASNSNDMICLLAETKDISSEKVACIQLNCGTKPNSNSIIFDYSHESGDLVNMARIVAFENVTHTPTIEVSNSGSSYNENAFFNFPTQTFTSITGKKLYSATFRLRVCSAGNITCYLNKTQYSSTTILSSSQPVAYTGANVYYEYVFNDTPVLNAGEIYSLTLISDAPSQTWQCYYGSIYIGGRSGTVNPITQVTSWHSYSSTFNVKTLSNQVTGSDLFIYAQPELASLTDVKISGCNFLPLWENKGFGVYPTDYLPENIIFDTNNPDNKPTMKKSYGEIYVNSTINTTSKTTGALTVFGGCGISKDLIVGGSIFGSVVSNTALFSRSYPDPILSVSDDSVTYGHFAVNPIGPTLEYDRQFHITNTTISTSIDTGAFICDGGCSISNNLYVNGSTTINGILTANNIIYENIEYITSSNESTDIHTGGSVIYGGCGIGKNVNIGGIETIWNTTDSTNFLNGSIITSGGVGINKSVNVGGILKIWDTTESTDILTGSLILNGGLSINKNVHIGGTVEILNTTLSTNSQTGCLVVSGGLGVASDTFIGGSLSCGAIISESITSNSTITSQGIYSNTGIYLGKVLVPNTWYLIYSMSSGYNDQIGFSSMTKNYNDELVSRKTFYMGSKLSSSIFNFSYEKVCGDSYHSRIISFTSTVSTPQLEALAGYLSYYDRRPVWVGQTFKSITGKSLHRIDIRLRIVTPACNLTVSLCNGTTYDNNNIIATSDVVPWTIGPRTAQFSFLSSSPILIPGNMYNFVLKSDVPTEMQEYHDRNETYKNGNLINVDPITFATTQITTNDLYFRLYVYSNGLSNCDVYVKTKPDLQTVCEITNLSAFNTPTWEIQGTGTWPTGHATGTGIIFDSDDEVTYPPNIDKKFGSLILNNNIICQKRAGIDNSVYVYGGGDYDVVPNHIIRTNFNTGTGDYNINTEVISGGPARKININDNILIDKGVNSSIKILSTINPTDTLTGALICNGGISIAKDLRVGGNIYGMSESYEVMSNQYLTGMVLSYASITNFSMTSGTFNYYNSTGVSPITQLINVSAQTNILDPGLAMFVANTHVYVDSNNTLAYSYGSYLDVGYMTTTKLYIGTLVHGVIGTTFAITGISNLSFPSQKNDLLASLYQMIEEIYPMVTVPMTIAPSGSLDLSIRISEGQIARPYIGLKSGSYDSRVTIPINLRPTMYGLYRDNVNGLLVSSTGSIQLLKFYCTGINGIGPLAAFTLANQWGIYPILFEPISNLILYQFPQAIYANSATAISALRNILRYPEAKSTLLIGYIIICGNATNLSVIGDASFHTGQKLNWGCYA